MKKQNVLIIIISIILVLLALVLFYFINKKGIVTKTDGNNTIETTKENSSKTIKVTSISGKTYNAKVGDNIEGVKIIEIKLNKVIVKHGEEEPEECKYGKKYEFWPDSQNGTVFYEEPETVLTFEK